MELRCQKTIRVRTHLSNKYRNTIINNNFENSKNRFWTNSNGKWYLNFFFLLSFSFFFVSFCHFHPNFLLLFSCPPMGSLPFIVASTVKITIIKRYFQLLWRHKNKNNNNCFVVNVLFYFWLLIFMRETRLFEN